MKVCELIELLERCEPEAYVYLTGKEGEFLRVAMGVMLHTQTDRVVKIVGHKAPTCGGKVIYPPAVTESIDESRSPEVIVCQPGLLETAKRIAKPFNSEAIT